MPEIDLKWIKKGYLAKTALRLDPSTERLTAVYKVSAVPEGTQAASLPYEAEIAASAWEATCFYFSNLRLHNFIVSGLVGILAGGVSILLGLGTGAVVTAGLVALVVLYLQARNPRFP